MKKISFAFALLLSIPSITSAAVMLPKTVSIGDGAQYDAGATVQMNFVNSDKPILRKNNIEYGVARTIKSGEFTSFEILSTDSKSLTGVENIAPLGFVIPNLVDTKGTSTYVAYIKFYEKDNPDNESFYFSKEFSIKVNNTPFIQIKNINLLQSNGKRFSTQQGPTIYSPEDAAKYSNEKLATSSSVEVTFVSNQDAVITPSVSFSKIRSDVFTEQYTAQPITVKKGTTYAVIPLPVFAYEPGVYMGELSFGTSLVKNKVDLQYIIAGDSVSVGTVRVTEKDKAPYFTLDIFGTPLDLDRTASTSDVANTYTVTTDFINDSGRVLYTDTQTVNFNGENFSIAIPKKYAEVAELKITVVSPTTKAVVYEATKTVDYSNPSAIKVSVILYILLYVLLTLIALISLVKGRIKTAIVSIVLLVGLFFARQVFAVYSIEQYSVDTKSTTFVAENVGAVPYMHLQDDVPNTIYACGENIQFTFKILYLRCSNTTALIDVGFSRVGLEDAFAKRVRLSNSLDTEEFLNTAGNTGHSFYASLSPFVTRTIPAVAATTSNLFITLDHSVGTGVTGGYNRYMIPLRNSCDMEKPTCSCTGRTQVCTQGGIQVSNTPNSPSCSLQASCSFTTSGNTATFNTIVSNAIGAIVYKDADTGSVITNPYQRQITPGASIVQRTIVSDVDGATATAVCTATTQNDDGGNGGGPTPPNGPATSTPRRVPTIFSFKANDPVVRKGQSCVYKWNVKDVDRCAVLVNNTSVLLQGKGLNGPISIDTADGNNQRAVLTCVAEDMEPSEGTISTSTLCQVLPEVIER